MLSRLCAGYILRIVFYLDVKVDVRTFDAGRTRMIYSGKRNR